MIEADWEEWASLEGIGKKTAQKVVKSVGGVLTSG
jgi:DNA uptake protein ComE-like DNA-binding protein